MQWVKMEGFPHTMELNYSDELNCKVKWSIWISRLKKPRSAKKRRNTPNGAGPAKRSGQPQHMKVEE